MTVDQMVREFGPPSRVERGAIPAGSGSGAGQILAAYHYPAKDGDVVLMGNEDRGIVALVASEPLP
jgi:hypothetical protein